MVKKILNDSAPDYRIDSARAIVPIVKDDDTDFPDGPARGIWLSEDAPATINYLEPDGTERTDFMLLPGPNMVLVKRVLTGGTAVDVRAIY